ncbi:MAG: hypothetical protein JWN54_208, partial [Mycobacterium sp.]|nr:hypothetical protein [Mycobacterium sp.]
SPRAAALGAGCHRVHAHSTTSGGQPHSGGPYPGPACLTPRLTGRGDDAEDFLASLQYGPEVKPGERHVVWRRVGTHNIFMRP